MIFADTSFWIALALRRHRRHQDAVRLWNQRTGEVVVTDHILGETWTFLRKRDSHRVAVEAIDRMLATNALTVVPIDAAAETEAWRWLRRHDERRYSFVDACSFATMRRLRIREVLAFDDDFAAAGFTVLRP